MKILVVGGGKVGSAICQQLLNEGHSIVLIDEDAKNVNRLVDSFDVNGVVGNGIVADIQKNAGVKNCDILIACTPFDEVNILCSTIAKKLGAKQTIARVRNPEYFNMFQSEELGLDLLVNPEHEAAMEIARLLEHPYATLVEEFVGGNIRLLEYRIPDGSEIDGLTACGISKEFGVNIVVCAVIRGDATIIPKGDFALRSGDRIFVTAEVAELHKFFRKVHVSKRRSKKVFVLGGGRTSFYLSERLSKNGVNVVVFEKDLEACKKLYEQFSKVTVLNADGFQQHILVEEGVDTADAVVALSDDNEDNIIISMFVNSICQKKAIVKIDRTEYVSMLEKAGIDSIVLPKMLTANQIVSFVRSLESKHGGKVLGLYRMVGSNAEFLEFAANDDFGGNDVPLKELKLRENTIVVAIVKNDGVTVAKESDCIKSGDKVLVVSTEQGFNELNDILA